MPQFLYNQHFAGLIGTIKELPLGFVVVEVDLPLLVGEIEPVEAGEKVGNEHERTAGATH